VALYADLFRYRELFLNLFQRELRTRYRGTVLGLGWTLVNPLALVGVYTLVFSVLWKAASVRHYPLFVVSGLAVWIFFQSSVQMASHSLLGQASLVRQVRFPRQLVPLAVVASNLVAYLAMLLVVVPINLVLVPRTRETFWAVIPLSLPLVALTSGLAMVFAAATVFFRDVEYLLLTILLPWFFLTPVLYELRSLPGVRDHPTLTDVLHWANFVTPVVETIRAPILYGNFAGLGDFVYTILAALAALALGAYVFARADDQLAIQL